ncbi:bactofilin family protein [Alkalicaulis satelles]|nr:polymer-forming cytoskeletal protein [Alkalicaulis satelles]
MKSRAPSILSADLTVQGSIVSEGEVQLDGAVEGDVKAGSLTIGEEATVKGEVVAETVVVRGRINGSVRARQVQLASTARVEGDVIHATLAIESGAYFDGLCRRSTDPLTDKGSGNRAAAPSSPPSAAQQSSTSQSPQPSAPKPPSATPSAPPPSGSAQPAKA